MTNKGISEIIQRGTTIFFFSGPVFDIVYTLKQRHQNNREINLDVISKLPENNQQV